jgi:hypothetical protein
VIDRQFAKWDPGFTEQLERLVGPVINTYFRTEVPGAERIPTAGGILLVGNHSVPRHRHRRDRARCARRHRIAPTESGMSYDHWLAEILGLAGSPGAAVDLTTDVASWPNLGGIIDSLVNQSREIRRTP